MDTIERRHDFLLCVDSDGCAIDSMNEKHTRAFCPELIRVYGLSAHEAFVTEYWMRINLFSKTRGINRFKGLAMTLKALADRGVCTEDWQTLCDFTAHAQVLSNAALEAALAEKESRGLALALEWSRAVNTAIQSLGEGKPFAGCKEALAALHRDMDIAVVSSANGAAVEHEWAAGGLSAHTDIRYGQEAGSKAACIQTLLASGYQQSHILMVGDALGDLEAAKANGVLFYPILVGSESESWARLAHSAGPAFLAQRYAKTMETEEIAKINAILQ